MGSHGPTLLSTQKLAYTNRPQELNVKDNKEIQDKISKMRGHNFEFKGLEKPYMMSTMKANFRETGGFIDGADAKIAKETQQDLRKHHFDMGK
jgi:hypothetical protein